MLSAAAITTSVLGPQALDRGQIGFATWVALASFFAIAVLSLAILWPRQHELGVDSIQIIRGCVENGKLKSVSELHRSLTRRMQLSYVANWKDLSQMAILFEIAGSLLAIEVLSCTDMHGFSLRFLLPRRWWPKPPNSP